MDEPKLINHQSLKRQKSKNHQKNKQPKTPQSKEIMVPPFPSIPRGFKSGNGNGTSSGSNKLSNGSYKESPGSESTSTATTPLRPPQLTVFGHALPTPPTPKSTRFQQDKVLPPSEKINLLPPDILGGTENVPAKTMTLQRSQFRHAKKPSLPSKLDLMKTSSDDMSLVANKYDLNYSNKTTPIDSGTLTKVRSFTNLSQKHPLPNPPLPNSAAATISQHKSQGTLNRNKDQIQLHKVSNGDHNNRTLERKRSDRNTKESDHFYRSKSLPRPSKYNHNNTKYDQYEPFDESLIKNSKSEIYKIEQQLTSFEYDVLKDFEGQNVNAFKAKNAVTSILHEEKRNMDIYILHCDD